jgi:CBS domain containing-hemolysin-like protein
MELVEALIHVANLSAFIVSSVLAITLLVILGGIIMGRNIILRSLEAMLPRGLSLTLRILAFLLLIVVIVSFAQTAYKGLTGSFGYEIYRFGGVQLLLLMALFGTILSLFFIAGFTILALKRVRSSTLRS